MDGVTILNAVEKGGFSIWGVIVFVLLAVTVCLLLYLFILLAKNDDGAAIPAFMLMTLCCISTIVVGCELWGPTYSEYKVIIDESVSFAEFTGKYEVVGQEGEIYTVVERTDD